MTLLTLKSTILIFLSMRSCWKQMFSKRAHALSFPNIIKVGLSSSKKDCFIYFNESVVKMIKNAFCVTLKALLVLKIFKFLSWLFGHAEKTAWLERRVYFQNLWRHNLVKKELQYTYCPISHEVETSRQWNLVT